MPGRSDRFRVTLLMSRTVLIQFASTSGARLVGALLQAVLLALVARAIAPDDFGVLAAFLGVCQFGQVVFDCGVSTFLVIERSAHPQSGKVTTALMLSDRLSSALGVACAMAIAGMAAGFGREYLVFLPLAVWLATERNSDTWLGVYFADGDWKVNLSNLLTKRIVALVLFMSISWFGVDPRLSFGLALAAASSASILIIRKRLELSLPDPDHLSFRDLISDAWPYWQASLATHLRSLDATITALSASAFQAGLYSSASRLTSPLRILPTSMAKALLPAAVRTRETTSQSLLVIALAMLASISIAYGALYFVLPPLLPVVLGESYAGAVPALKIVLAGMPFAAGASLFGSLLQGRGEKRYVAHSAIATTILYLLVLPIAAFQGGANGAAAILSASFGANAFLLGGKLYLLRGGTPGHLETRTVNENPRG